jgi:hypothetical protein
MTLCGNPLLRSLSGAKRTWVGALHMSAPDPKRTFEPTVQQFLQRMHRVSSINCRDADKSNVAWGQTCISL